MSKRQAPGLASPRVAATVPFRAAKAGCCPDGPAAGTPSTNSLKLVAAYARVSSDKQEKEQTIEALIGFRGGDARTGKLGCEHLVREQRRE